MNFWRPNILLSLVAILLTGCVYVPPYYDDPYSPSPWLHLREPYPPRNPYFRYQPEPDPYLRRRYRDDWRYRDRGYDTGPPEYRPSTPNTDREQSIPPSKVEIPDSPKGSTSPEGKDIPTASKGSKPGRVKLPFPPYSELDVSGMQSGSLARDPTSGKIFRIP